MNPFSLPTNDSLLYSYREQQRVIQTELDREIRAIPIYDRSPEVKIPAVAEFRKTFLPSISPSSKVRNSFISNRENIDDFIQRKREILFVKKSIENKQKNIEHLESTISERDKNHKETLRNLEEQFSRVEKYEENLMIEAKKKAEITDAKVKERIHLQNLLSRLTEDIEISQVAYERKLEELKQYEVYRKFLNQISQQMSFTREENMFLTQDNLLCSNPGQILESINELESSNLFQVRQLQEVEQELELLKSQNQAFEQSIEGKLETLKSSIKVLEKQKEGLMFKTRNLVKEETEAHVIDEKTLEEIHLRLLEFMDIVGNEKSSNPNDLEMLEIVELALSEKMEQRALMDEEFMKKLEKEVEKARRVDKIEKLKEKEVRKREEINELLKQRKNKIVKKTGRIVMPRSKIVEKIAQTKEPVIPQEVLDRIEFLDEHLTK
ncbi:hypothetical protein SteCoe_31795 [Stentor coeruleus]|uniref:DUF4200 domain-containing protein n=1 Tax=Stentor coeruleus TaxID=5963 RepID=A0A1R2B0G7_9CILI|nr:hypothetical protein SteCoe_31795 [Stentor coeruleus]